MNVKTAVRVCRLSLGAVWFYEGLVPKLLVVRPDQVDLVRRSKINAGTPDQIDLIRANEKQLRNETFAKPNRA